MLGRQANVVAKKLSHAPIPFESPVLPSKSSIAHVQLRHCFVTSKPQSTTDLASVAKSTPISSGSLSAIGRTAQSQESARSRPYNSNFSYLFEAKDAGSPNHDIITKVTASHDNEHGQSMGWASNPWSLSTDSFPKSSASNIVNVQTPHPPVSLASEHSSASVTAKRRKYASISNVDFTPLKNAYLTVRSLSSRPISQANNGMIFGKHVAISPRKIRSSAALSDATTELKEAEHSSPSISLIGSKADQETLQPQSNPIIKSSARGKGVHSVVFQVDQVGPSLDRDLEHDENLSFTMSPWKSGA